MESIQRIQNIVDKNKELLTSDDYNTICMQMKEIFKKKKKEPTDYVKITYIDYPIAPLTSGYNEKCDYDNNCDEPKQRLDINTEIKNTVIKIDKEKLENYENFYNNNGYIKFRCHELNWECDCQRSHRLDFLEEELNLSFNIDTHTIIKIEKII